MSRWPNKYVIGLTGNIAVGKSVVRQMLQHLGAYTIDADGLSHQAMQPGAPAYKPVVETFGQFILDQDKRIDRATLGRIVFANPQALAKLESIVHPIVGQAISTLVARAKQRVVVIEAIKLLEGNLADAVDTVWVVNASPETQLKRLMEKRGMPEDEARQRILAQPPQAQKLARANVVIDNDGSVDRTWQQVQQAWAQVRQAVMSQTAAQAQPPAPAAQPAPPSAATSQPAAPAASAAALATAAVEIKRGMPGDAENIAAFINRVTGSSITRMDVMIAFGQKGYLLAKSQGRIVGLMGWQVENLITRADEFHIEAGVPRAPVIEALVNAIEDASKLLQSEVGFFFLPLGTSADIIEPFHNSGYETTTVEQIKIPAWREAVQEVISENSNYIILTKKLREDRVLQPL
ncbi:MAG: dephospho-CoA kinase [Aggregatilineales bacterium]